MYRCPVTGYRVQGFSAEDTSEDRHTCEPVTCPACHQIHHVNPATGAVLGEKAETVSAANRLTQGIEERALGGPNGERGCGSCFYPAPTERATTWAVVPVRQFAGERLGERAHPLQTPQEDGRVTNATGDFVIFAWMSGSRRDRPRHHPRATRPRASAVHIHSVEDRLAHKALAPGARILR
jgi:hypothetical protein